MPFNVSTFAAQGLPYGGARASLFEVFLALPAGIAEPTAEAQFRFVCKASSIPASTLGTVEVPYFGRKVKMAGNRTFDNWQVTIMNDEDFLVRNAFELWSSYINSHENNLRNVRRYNVYVDNIIFNVSLGIFPGTYEKTRIQVKVEKKRPVYKVRKFSKGVPRSMSENYKERENLIDPASRRKIDKK
jgi:hypothetical protein